MDTSTSNHMSKDPERMCHSPPPMSPRKGPATESQPGHAGIAGIAGPSWLLRALQPSPWPSLGCLYIIYETWIVGNDISRVQGDT